MQPHSGEGVFDCLRLQIEIDYTYGKSITASTIDCFSLCCCCTCLGRASYSHYLLALQRVYHSETSKPLILLQRNCINTHTDTHNTVIIPTLSMESIDDYDNECGDQQTCCGSIITFSISCCAALTVVPHEHLLEYHHI